MPTQLYLDDMIGQFRALKQMADRALAQVNDEQFFEQLDPESNSLAIIVKHVSGNLISRWTDFLTADGEKPDRRRDSEFRIEAADTRVVLMQFWETGWQRLFDALTALTAEDLTRTVHIRSEGHTVVQAMNRQLAHYANHVGQIVFLAKHSAGPHWKTLSIPRGKSEEFNERMQRGRAEPVRGLPGHARLDRYLAEAETKEDKGSMPDKLTVVARCKAKPGKEAEVHKALLALLAPTRLEAGCINYDMHESLDDPGSFLFYENWESREILDRHIQMPHLQAFFARADELLAEPVEIKFYRMVGQS